MKKEVRRGGFSWKEFFKPTKLKIFLTILFFLTLPFLMIWEHNKGNCYDPKIIPCVGIEHKGTISFWSMWVLLGGIVKQGSKVLTSNFFFLILPGVVVSLVLSSFLALLIPLGYNQIKNRKLKLIFSIVIIAAVLLSLVLFYPAYLEISKPPQYINPGSACMNVRVTINPTHSCYNNLTKEIRISISKGQEDFVLNGLALTFPNSKIIIINRTSNNYRARMNNSAFGMPLELPNYSNPEKDYIINLSDLGDPKEVGVAGIVKIGNTARTCGVTDRLTRIKKCEPTEEELTYCEKDKDCIKVNDGCCSCNMGGKNRTVNLEYSDFWNNKMAEECEGTGCWAVISNDWTCFAKPKCVNNKCILVKE